MTYIKARKYILLYLKQTLSVALLSLSLLSVNSHAEQGYQTEITVGYEKEDADTSTDKVIMLSAEIFFSPVNIENKPLAVASFLDKSSSVLIGYVSINSELENAPVNSIDSSGLLFGINYITETNAIILGAVYSKQDIDSDPNLVTGDGRITGIDLGKYLNDSSTLDFSYINIDSKARSTVSNQTISTDVDHYKLSYKTVHLLNATSYYSFNAGIELIKASDSNSVKEDNNQLSIQGEYFFTRMTSLSVRALFNSGDDVSDEGKTFEIGGAHFFSPQIAFKIGLTTFKADNSQTEDEDSILIGVTARF